MHQAALHTRFHAGLEFQFQASIQFWSEFDVCNAFFSAQVIACCFLGVLPYHQIHYIEVVQGGVSNRAIHN